MTRSCFNWTCGSLSAILGVISLIVAINESFVFESCSRPCIGKLLVGFWVLAPPIFFWVDWVVFCRGLSKAKLEVARHTHDLSRNIWLALIVMLAATFGLKLSG